MRVDAVIIGAQKSGTTSLAYQMAQHPAMSIAAEKEPHFFSKRDDWQAALPRYHALFTPEEGQLCFEASTSYSFLPEYAETAERLAAYNPELKLIYLIREPVARIASHYLHRLRRGKVFRGPQAEVLNKPIYLDRSRYAMQLRPYLARFPREQILVLIFEEHVADPKAGLAQISDFLGIAPEGFATVDTTSQYVTRAQGFHGERRLRRALAQLPGLAGLDEGRSLFDRFAERITFSPALREELWRRLEPDVQDLESLLGRRIDAWRRHSDQASAASSPA